MPDLSLIVIAYNEAKHIEQCLTALSNQDTSLNFEIIVVDDGSTDETAVIVSRVAAVNPTVRLERQPANFGRGAARRRGQDAAQSPLIGFVDADIVVPCDWVSRCVEALAGRAAVSGVASPDGDCAVIWRIFSLTFKTRPGTSHFTGNNVIFTAEALELEGFETTSRLGEDFRLSQRMARRGLSMRTISDLVVEHHEAKSYRKAMKWMWENGVDAASLPFEFSLVRLPDVTWAGWLIGSGVSVIAAVSAGVPWIVPVGFFVLATAAIDGAYMASRFSFASSPFRWVIATAANVPLMLGYLSGRTWGFAPALRRSLRSSS